MSVESILSHILNKANAQKEKIVQEAKIGAEAILREAKKEAGKIYQEILDREKAVYESQRHKLIVNARLESKKNLLKAKQELIDSVFKELKSELGKIKLKKQQVTQDKVQEVAEDIDFYLSKIRPDYEGEIAKVLFR